MNFADRLGGLGSVEGGRVRGQHVGVDEVLKVPPRAVRQHQAAHVVRDKRLVQRDQFAAPALHRFRFNFRLLNRYENFGHCVLFGVLKEPKYDLSWSPIFSE
jgi:hypothetical protein